MMKFVLFLLGGVVWIAPQAAWSVEEYTIDGEFDGCDHGKMYPLQGGGILECQEYNYFYEYSPRVIADGHSVIMIGDDRVDGILHNGAVYVTNISDEFEGCDYDNIYELDNGLLFQCQTYSYSYSYRPEVKIFVVEGQVRSVIINDEEYDGTLYKK